MIDAPSRELSPGKPQMCEAILTILYHTPELGAIFDTFGFVGIMSLP